MNSEPALTISSDEPCGIAVNIADNVIETVHASQPAHDFDRRRDMYLQVAPLLADDVFEETVVAPLLDDDLMAQLAAGAPSPQRPPSTASPQAPSASSADSSLDLQLEQRPFDPQDPTQLSWSLPAEQWADAVMAHYTEEEVFADLRDGCVFSPERDTPTPTSSTTTPTRPTPLRIVPRAHTLPVQFMQVDSGRQYKLPSASRIGISISRHRLSHRAEIPPRTPS